MKIKRLLLNKLLRMGLTDKYRQRAFRIPRRWSNRELRRFGHLFSGDVVNVSAWEDRDKEGGFYRNYFPATASYSTTNFGTSQDTLQHTDNEIYLDLSKPIPPELERRFDAVFNHTTLEHLFEFQTAFANLCAMSRDVVIIVVPWLQPLHSDYGDFWRFSPQALPRMFSREGLTTLHLSWNDDKGAAVYVFAIASRNPEAWREHFPDAIADPWSPEMVSLPPNNAGRATFS